MSLQLLIELAALMGYLQHTEAIIAKFSSMAR